MNMKQYSTAKIWTIDILISFCFMAWNTCCSRGGQTWPISDPRRQCGSFCLCPGACWVLGRARRLSVWLFTTWSLSPLRGRQVVLSSHICHINLFGFEHQHHSFDLQTIISFMYDTVQLEGTGSVRCLSLFWLCAPEKISTRFKWLFSFCPNWVGYLNLFASILSFVISPQF